MISVPRINRLADASSLGVGRMSVNADRNYAHAGEWEGVPRADGDLEHLQFLCDLPYGCIFLVGCDHKLFSPEDLQGRIIGTLLHR
jgi:hypothetical protein